MENDSQILWDIETRSDTPERIVFIYEALVKLNLPPDFSIIDMAGGRGVIINGIAGLFPQCRPTIVDIRHYDYDWRKLRKNIKRIIMPLQEFIEKDDGVYDVMLMLNSYRNWKKDKKLPHRLNSRINFDRWLRKHVKYFITSGGKFHCEQGEIRGYDYRGTLQLFKLPLSKK